MPKESTTTTRRRAAKAAPVEDVEETVTKKKTTRRSTKKEKDPNAPKRFLSAYMFFANENRDTVKAENPDATFGGLGKLLGEKWKSMDENDKKPYEDMAKKDRERYEKQMETYRSSKE